MISNYSEKQMVLDYCKILEKENVSFAVEVPFYNRSIDLVYIDKKGNLCALEFKLNDWKKAISQAKDCSSGAQKVYVCIPKKKYSMELEEQAEKVGCGLIIFDVESKNKVVLKESKNHSIWDGAYRILSEGYSYSVENNNYQQLLSI